MGARSFKDEGIVLRRISYSEADRIIWIFSKYHGKLSLLAKGVRKPGSRKRGHIEVFSHIEFSVSSGKNIDVLTEVETLEGFEEIRKDLRKASVAYFLLESVGKLIREGEVHVELFTLLLGSLRKLTVATRLKDLRDGFTRAALVLLGFWPARRAMPDPDFVLQEITEREFSSIRVGKRLQ